MIRHLPGRLIERTKRRRGARLRSLAGGWRAAGAANYFMENLKEDYTYGTGI